MVQNATHYCYGNPSGFQRSISDHIKRKGIGLGLDSFDSLCCGQK